MSLDAFIAGLIIGGILGWLVRTWVFVRDQDCANEDHNKEP